MRCFLLLCFLLLSACSNVEPESNKLHRLTKATKLYSCYYFFSTTAESTSDLLLRSRFFQISDSLLLQAKAIALEVGGERLDEQVSKSGKLDFKKFMKLTLKIHNRGERNQTYLDFTQSCADQSGIILNAG